MGGWQTLKEWLTVVCAQSLQRDLWAQGQVILFLFKVTTFEYTSCT